MKITLTDINVYLLNKIAEHESDKELKILLKLHDMLEVIERANNISD